MSNIVLPTELLPQVFEELGCNDLCAVSLVSRPFRYEGQRIIFRQSGRLVLGPDVQSMGAKFLDATTNSPHRLALSVRSLELELKIFQTERLIVTLVRKLERALVILMNLKTLRIWGRIAPLPHPLNPIPHTLLKCTFHLHTFEWGLRRDAELLIPKFIRQQTGISDLSFIGSSSGLNLEMFNGLGHQLESLKARMTIMAAIMQGVDHPAGSPLTYYRCTDMNRRYNFDAIVPPPPTKLSAAFSGIRVLQYDHEAIFVDPPLREMAKFLRKIVLLALRVQNFREITQEYYDTLGCLPTLQKFILCMPHIHNYDALDVIAGNVFSRCPNLQYMDVQCESKTSGTERYTRIPGEMGCQSQTLTSDEEQYSWNRRRDFVSGN